MAADFAKHLGDRNSKGVFVWDERTLPHSKNEILNALLLKILQSSDRKIARLYCSIAIALSDYQPDVGEEGLALPFCGSSFRIGLDNDAIVDLALKLKKMDFEKITRNVAIDAQKIEAITWAAMMHNPAVSHIFERVWYKICSLFPRKFPEV